VGTALPTILSPLLRFSWRHDKFILHLLASDR